MAEDHHQSPHGLFSSRRERHLWLWTLALVIAIYATLGLASTIAGAVTDNQAAIGFLVAMALIGLTILTQGLRARPRGIEIGVALGIAVVYLMIVLRMAIPERSHLIEYSVVAVFVYEALTERAGNGRRVPVPALLAIGATTAVGVLDECIQALLPSRVFDRLDMLFNFLAAVLAVVACIAPSWARRWGRRVRSP